MEWFAVRGVIKNADAYEERVTLWRANSEDEAISKAETEAAEYAGDGMSVLPLFQSYRLADPPDHGGEVFSLIRRSPLSPDAYLDAFFDTGEEVQRHD
jgi:hypothetical protein